MKIFAASLFLQFVNPAVTKSDDSVLQGMLELLVAYTQQATCSYIYAAGLEGCGSNRLENELAYLDALRRLERSFLVVILQPQSYRHRILLL